MRADFSGAASYDAIPDFGTLYDSIPVYGARGDVAFYTNIAAESGSPVLEVGCGTGRILLPIARAGVAITGLDGSTDMLARLESKLAHEPSAVRERVIVHHGDASHFDLGTTFPLIIAPFRILQHLVTIDEQLGCLTAVARHLAPGGRFVFDVFNPHFTYFLRDRSAEAEDTPKFTLDNGRTLSRSARTPRVRFVDQVSETELIYYVSRPGDAQPTRYVQRFDMRWYLRAELVHLLARAGLRVETVVGNFDGTALTDASPEQIVTAVKEPA